MAQSRFKFEREFLKRGLSLIAGMDEAGRGPLAGPVVAAAVCLPAAWMEEGALPRKLFGLNDSKQLDAETRDKFFEFLTTHADVRFAVAVVEPEVIDHINILQASFRAMNEAFKQLLPVPEHTLVDGPYVTTWKHPQTPIADGDAKSYSIAAASVIAKVTRDRLMIAYHLQYPGYGFAEHKGYATAQHLEALSRLGPCPIHRKSFHPVRQPEPELFQASA